MPSNLLIIVAAQALVLLLVWPILRRRWGGGDIRWLRVMAVGLVSGMTLDLVLGTRGVFGYWLPDVARPVEPGDLPLLMLLFNWFGSYGLAAATLVLVAPGCLGPWRRVTAWNVPLGLGVLAGLAGVLLLPSGHVGTMPAWGAVIVCAGEMVLCRVGRLGPLLALVAASEWRPLARFWAFCLLVGASYEAVNLTVPFWVWLPESALPQVALSALVALVGYVALFHPMLVLCVLVGARWRLLSAPGAGLPLRACAPGSSAPADRARP